MATGRRGALYSGTCVAVVVAAAVVAAAAASFAVAVVAGAVAAAFVAAEAAAAVAVTVVAVAAIRSDPWKCARFSASLSSNDKSNVSITHLKAVLGHAHSYPDAALRAEAFHTRS